MARPMPLVSPCAPWLCRGTSTPTGLARAATTRLVALRATTSMASSITPTGSTIYSSPPPWEGENYEPRNPMESGAFYYLLLLAEYSAACLVQRAIINKLVNPGPRFERRVELDQRLWP